MIVKGNDGNKYAELDALATDGVYTAPMQYETDLKGLREYCRKTGKKMEDLTDAELSGFRRHGPTKAAL